MSLEPYTKSNQVGTPPYSIDVGQYIESTALTNISWKNVDTGLPAWAFGQNSLSGFKNPFWRSQVRLGQGATTNCSGVSFTEDLGWHRWGRFDWVIQPSIPGRQWLIKYDVGMRFASPIASTGGYIAPPSDTVTRVTNRVIQKFLDACQSARSAFEAGQDFGEYKETLESIHRPLHSLSDKLTSYLSSLEKAKKRYKRSPILRKVLADTYLEFHFGWMPLVDDIASAIVKCGSIRPPRIPINVSASEDFRGVVGQTSLSMTGHTGDTHPFVRTRDHSSYKLRYRGSINTGVDANGRTSGVQELQLLPRNWLPTAWDLLPYSWIADYFTNIGEMIQSLCFVFSDLAWAQKTSIVKRTFSYCDVVDGSYYYWNVTPGLQRLSAYAYNIPATTTFTRQDWSRSILLPSDLFPRFQFRIPSSKYPYYNLAALLSSRAKKLVPFF